MSRIGRPPVPMLGRRFGRLVVVAECEVRNHDGGIIWRCLCDCGNFTELPGSRLRRQVTGSCGCLGREMASARLSKHGLTRTPEYKAWSSARERCNNPAHPAYHNYGGRGIHMASAWDDFATFLAHIGPRPASRSLDRIDNAGHYEPGNVKWSTASEQRRNQRPRA